MEVGPKRLELLHQVVPTAAVIALLVNPTRPNAGNLSKDIESAARTLGLQLHVMEAKRGAPNRQEDPQCPFYAHARSRLDWSTM